MCWSWKNAALTMEETCGWRDRESSKKTPRFLVDVAGWIISWPIVMVWVEDAGLCLDWRARNSVSPSFNLRLFRGIHHWILAMQASSFTKVACWASGEWGHSHMRYNWASSTYKWNPVLWDLIISLKAKVYMLNNIVAKTELWVTPHVRVSGSEWVPDVDMHWIVSER